MSWMRFACLILVVAVAALGCANGRPKPVTCAVIGGITGGTAGAYAGAKNDTGDDVDEAAAFGAAGGILLGVAGYYICKAFEAEEPLPEPAPAAVEPPPPAPPLPRGSQ